MLNSCRVAIAWVRHGFLTHWACRLFHSFYEDKRRWDRRLFAQIFVHGCSLHPRSLVGEGKWGTRREGYQHCPSHTEQPEVSPATCFSGQGPPLASFLRGLPQRVGVLAQPGCRAALVSAAESGFSTGSWEKGKREVSCGLRSALSRSTREGQGWGPNTSIRLQSL